MQRWAGLIWVYGSEFPDIQAEGGQGRKAGCAVWGDDEKTPCGPRPARHEIRARFFWPGNPGRDEKTVQGGADEAEGARAGRGGLRWGPWGRQEKKKERQKKPS